MKSRPRLLLIGTPPTSVAELLDGAEVCSVSDPVAATEQLAAEAFDAVVAEPAALDHWSTEFRRDELILAHIDNGVAVLDERGLVTWAGTVFRTFCPDEPLGKPLLAAMAAKRLASDASDPVMAARTGRTVVFRLHRSEDVERQFLDVTIRPVLGSDGSAHQMVVIVRNVTSEVEQQKKFDALHQAGRELAGLTADQLAEMNRDTRVELLRQNLRRTIHDLLHYDIIEIRLLDRATGELKPLLADGMTREAAQRTLFARRTGNGVTGFVASVGESRLCVDTAQESLYLQGADGACSSMTVPLKYEDEVIGTFNVESPRPGAFGADDLQFAELFSKEIAVALHTLDLLSAQQTSTAATVIDAISRESCLPLDEILGQAALILQNHPEGAAAEAARSILSAARRTCDSLRKVAAEANVVGEPTAGLSGIRVGTPLLGRRVLVVDASERHRQSAHQFLGRLGAHVTAADTVAKGCALAAESTFDAVFLDIKPADCGGYDGYKRLSAAAPNAKMALMTGFGYDVSHAIVKARQDGLQHVLFKPFQQDQVVNAVLGKTQAITPLLSGGPRALHPFAPAASGPPTGGKG